MMSANPGGVQRSWRGAAGLREERGRNRRRIKAAGLIGMVFVYGLLQVWMSTQAAERRSRIGELRTELKRMEVDLAAARARLDERRNYSDLIAPAEQSGFRQGGERRALLVEVIPSEQPAGVWERVSEELRRGSLVLLSEALAQNRRAEGPGGAEHP